VEKLKYLGATLTMKIACMKRFKSRQNLGNACYHLVQSFLSSCLLFWKCKSLKYTKPWFCQLFCLFCETWCLTLREEHRLRVFANRVLRRISGLKRDEVTGEWKKFHNEELHNLYSPPNIIRQIRSRRMR
jgi:hypothetical protein